MYNRIPLLWRFSGVYPISIKKYHISKSGTDSPGSRRQGSEYCNSITNNKHIPRLKDYPNCIDSYKWEYSEISYGYKCKSVFQSFEPNGILDHIWFFFTFTLKKNICLLKKVLQLLRNIFFWKKICNKRGRRSGWYFHFQALSYGMCYLMMSNISFTFLAPSELYKWRCFFFLISFGMNVWMNKLFLQALIAHYKKAPLPL